jgi:hypothetical protein
MEDIRLEPMDSAAGLAALECWVRSTLDSGLLEGLRDGGSTEETVEGVVSPWRRRKGRSNP